MTDAPEFVERQGSGKYACDEHVDSLTRIYEVDWGDRQQMVDHLMGDLPFGLPREDPDYPNKFMYCDQIDDVHGEGKLDNSPNNTAKYDKAVITARFRSRYEFFCVRAAQQASTVFRRREVNLSGQYIPIKTELLAWLDNTALNGVSCAIQREQIDLREVIPYLSYASAYQLINSIGKQYNLFEQYDWAGNYSPPGPRSPAIGIALISSVQIREMEYARVLPSSPTGRRFELTVGLTARQADFNYVYRPNKSPPGYEAIQVTGGPNPFKPFGDILDDNPVTLTY